MKELTTLQTNLRNTLLANGIKEGTKKAQNAEFFFLQGAVAAGINLPILGICMMSGRSILTINPQ